MAVRFQLHKPRYEWRTFQGPTQPPHFSLGSDLFLADEVKEWLESNHVVYDTWTQNIQSNLDGKTYLYFFIMIEDDNQAMQFKLAWM